MVNSGPTDWDLASAAFLKSSKIDDAAEQTVNERLIELAEIVEGDTVVDVATGIGNPALAVARRVGPRGRVIATDQSSGMLEVAATRANDAGLTNIEFRQLDANEFNFAAATIDAVVCRWGLMFLSDLTDALSRMRKSLKAGRCLAAATWSEPARVPIISLRRQVMRAFDIPAGANDPFRLSSPTTLKAAAGSAGFGEVEVTRSVVPYEYPSAQAFVDAQRTMHESRLTSLLARTHEEQDKFWSALGAAARPYIGTDGAARLPCEILLLAARTHR
jgi:ubiquinone/menaquinone biosynthesis C-methylase UbiE